MVRRFVAALVALTLILVLGRNAETQSAAQQIPPPAAPPKTTPQSPAPAKPQAPKISPIPAAAANPLTGWDERTFPVPVVGEAFAYIPKHPATPHVILFLSGDGEWNLGVVDMARRIMPKAIVVGVSYVKLRKAVAPDAKCWAPAADLDTIGHAVEKQLGIADYQPPILLGYSSGATMVYGALAILPDAFAGGLAMGFCPDLPASRSVCGTDTFKPPARNVKTNVVWLPKVQKLERPFYVVNGVQDKVCVPDVMHQFLDDMEGAHFTEAPGTGHGFSRPNRWGSAFDTSLAELLVAANAWSHAKKTP